MVPLPSAVQTLYVYFNWIRILLATRVETYSINNLLFDRPQHGSFRRSAGRVQCLSTLFNTVDHFRVRFDKDLITINTACAGPPKLLLLF